MKAGITVKLSTRMSPSSLSQRSFYWQVLNKNMGRYFIYFFSFYCSYMFSLILHHLYGIFLKLKGCFLLTKGTLNNMHPFVPFVSIRVLVTVSSSRLSQFFHSNMLVQSLLFKLKVIYKMQKCKKVENNWPTFDSSKHSFIEARTRFFPCFILPGCSKYPLITHFCLKIFKCLRNLLK